MGDFPISWLTMREPIDHRSRSRAVASDLRTAFAPVRELVVVDLGCGTGAHLRATASWLGRTQDWTLLDNDPDLLEAAPDLLGAWADAAQRLSDGMRLRHDRKTITVRLRQCDIAEDPDASLPDGTHLVTASAFFDLVSPAFIDRLVAAVVRRRAAFYTVLTYDGTLQWTPSSVLDGPINHAFNAHQAGDKGFGPAAGPGAPTLLRQAFDAAGYRTTVGDSAWHLGRDDRALMTELIGGVAASVAETGLVDPTRIAAWQAQERQGARVGHSDILALPPG